MVSDTPSPSWHWNGKSWEIPDECYLKPLAYIHRPDPTPDGTVYASRADMHRDMADPRYKTDRDFRRTVATKLAATQAARQRG